MIEAQLTLTFFFPRNMKSWIKLFSEVNRLRYSMRSSSLFVYTLFSFAMPRFCPSVFLSVYFSAYFYVCLCISVCLLLSLLCCLFVWPYL